MKTHPFALNGPQKPWIMIILMSQLWGYGIKSVISSRGSPSRRIMTQKDTDITKKRNQMCHNGLVRLNLNFNLKLNS